MKNIGIFIPWYRCIEIRSNFIIWFVILKRRRKSEEIYFDGKINKTGIFRYPVIRKIFKFFRKFNNFNNFYDKKKIIVLKELLIVHLFNNNLSTIL